MTFSHIAFLVQKSNLYRSKSSNNLRNQFLVEFYVRKGFLFWKSDKKFLEQKCKFIIALGVFRKKLIFLTFSKSHFWGINQCCTTLNTSGISFSLNLRKKRFFF